MFKKKKSTRELVGASPEETIETPPKKKKEKPPKQKPEKAIKFPVGKNLLHNRVVLGGISIFVALFVAFGVTPIFNALISDSTQAVRVKTDISRGATLASDQLETVKVHAGDFTGNVITDPASVIGKYAATDLQAGDVLTAKKITDTFPSDDPILIELPAGKLAMSIQMQNNAESVSGKLRPGDIIRLYAYMNNSVDNGGYQAMSLPELQYIEVLAVTNDNMRDLDNQSESEKKDTEKSEKQISTLTLAVNSQQAATLSGLNNCATLHAALVVRGDAATKAAALANQDEYFRSGAAPTEVQAVTAAPESGKTVTADKASPTTPAFSAEVLEPEPTAEPATSDPAIADTSTP